MNKWLYSPVAVKGLINFSVYLNNYVNYFFLESIFHAVMLKSHRIFWFLKILTLSLLSDSFWKDKWSFHLQMFCMTINCHKNLVKFKKLSYKKSWVKFDAFLGRNSSFFLKEDVQDWNLKKNKSWRPLRGKESQGEMIFCLICVTFREWKRGENIFWKK